eukprot:g15576.t1
MAKYETMVARAVVARAAATITVDPQDEKWKRKWKELAASKLVAAAAAAITPPRERQVEGGISAAPGSAFSTNGQPGGGPRPDLAVAEVFRDWEENIFGETMLAAVNDFRTPLHTVFDRVKNLPHREFCELNDFYRRVWKNTPDYQTYKSLRRFRNTMCTVCHGEEPCYEKCAAECCRKLVHKSCATGRPKAFCSESCYLLVQRVTAAAAAQKASASVPTSAARTPPPHRPSPLLEATLIAPATPTPRPPSGAPPLSWKKCSVCKTLALETMLTCCATCGQTLHRDCGRMFPSRDRDPGMRWCPDCAAGIHVGRD